MSDEDEREHADLLAEREAALAYIALWGMEDALYWYALGERLAKEDEHVVAETLGL